MDNREPVKETLAMVRQRRDGRWEVLVAKVDIDQLEDTAENESPYKWRHKRMFPTEQEAEAYARSILPNCDAAWEPKVLAQDEGTRLIPRREPVTRKPQHRPMA